MKKSQWKIWYRAEKSKRLKLKKTNWLINDDYDNDDDIKETLNHSTH